MFKQSLQFQKWTLLNQKGNNLSSCPENWQWNWSICCVYIVKCKVQEAELDLMLIWQGITFSFFKDQCWSHYIIQKCRWKIIICIISLPKLLLQPWLEFQQLRRPIKYTTECVRWYIFDKPVRHYNAMMFALEVLCCYQNFISIVLFSIFIL